MSIEEPGHDQDLQPPSLHEFISAANHPLLQGASGTAVTSNEAASTALQHAQHKRQKTSHLPESATQAEGIKEDDKKEASGGQAGESSDQDEDEEEFCGPALDLFFNQPDVPEPLEKAAKPESKYQEKES